MKEMTGLNFKINEMARRIKELREIVGFTPAEMAEKTDMTIEDYIACERGEKDLTFAFLYRCAIAFNVDVNDTFCFLVIPCFSAFRQAAALSRVKALFSHRTRSQGAARVLRSTTPTAWNIIILRQHLKIRFVNRFSSDAILMRAAMILPSQLMPVRSLISLSAEP